MIFYKSETLSLYQLAQQVNCDKDVDKYISLKKSAYAKLDGLTENKNYGAILDCLDNLGEYLYHTKLVQERFEFSTSDIVQMLIEKMKKVRQKTRNPTKFGKIAP